MANGALPWQEILRALKKEKALDPKIEGLCL
jgi:hypothetical protein